MEFSRRSSLAGPVLVRDASPALTIRERVRRCNKTSSLTRPVSCCRMSGMDVLDLYPVVAWAIKNV